MLWLAADPCIVCLASGCRLQSKKNPQNIRVVDWNVQSFNGLSKNKETRSLIRNEVAQAILNYQPDIVCLQEFNSSTQRNNEDNISLFSKALPYHYFSKDYLRNKGSYQSGSIIFSRYPIVDSGKINFPVAESLIYVDVKRGYDTLRIFTTHLQSFKFKKEDYQDIEKSRNRTKRPWRLPKIFSKNETRIFEKRCSV